MALKFQYKLTGPFQLSILKHQLAFKILAFNPCVGRVSENAFQVHIAFGHWASSESWLIEIWDRHGIFLADSQPTLLLFG